MIKLSFGSVGLLHTNLIVIAILVVTLLLSLRKDQQVDLLPVSVSQELKGLAILSIVFAHISYMLVSDKQYLYPLSVAAGAGVDLFLFMSGFGLTLGLLKQHISPLEFYRRRLTRVFIPLWVVVVLLFCSDTLLLHANYPLLYVLRSLLGWFPTANGFGDVNSPFWYISWLMMFYVLLPLLFNRQRPWLTALALAVIANIVAFTDPFNLQVDWLYRLHTNAFSVGMVVAWFIYEPTKGVNSFALKLKALRNSMTPVMRYTTMLVMMLLAVCFIRYGDAGAWPKLAGMLTAVDIDAKSVIGQLTSLVAMLALVLAFALKRVEFGFLYLFGVYSFETYLIHWPLMSRYDVFFNHISAWLAPLLWLSVFIVLGWLLQMITTPLSDWFERQLSPVRQLPMPQSPRQFYRVQKMR